MFKKSTLFLIISLLLFETLLISYNIKPQKLKINFCERFRFVSWDNAINLNEGNECVLHSYVSYTWQEQLE